MKTLSVPKRIQLSLIDPAAVPVTLPLPFIPETDMLILDLGQELQAHDVVLTVFKKHPDTFYINKLGMGILPRGMWVKRERDEFSAMACFVSHREKDRLITVPMDELDTLEKVAYWRDADGEFHAVDEVAERA